MITLELDEIHKEELDNIIEKIKSLSDCDKELKFIRKSQCQDGWSTRDKPFYKQNFKKKNYWHRIRSRCF